MRYRKLDEDGDYTIGKPGEFLVDSPAGVAQAINTRLQLIAGEWFLDITEGTPYDAQVLGFHSAPVRDAAMQDRIVGTQGVRELLQYASSIDNSTRVMTIYANVDSIYGPVKLEGTF